MPSTFCLDDSTESSSLFLYSRLKWTVSRRVQIDPECYPGAVLQVPPRCLKEEQEASAKKAAEKSFSAVTSAASSASSLSLVGPAEVAPPLSPSPAAHAVVESPAIPAAEPPAVQPGRCVACRKRVGLTGFRCRCGEMLCGSHQYPEQQRCTFDFKLAGWETYRQGRQTQQDLKKSSRWVPTTKKTKEEGEEDAAPSRPPE